MFSGHIRELGLVDSFDGERIQVRVPGSAPAISTGSSVCVSGVRLTVQDLGDEVFGATVAAETRRRSTFDSLGVGDRVNVELPLTAGAALDGHLVQGYATRPGRSRESRTKASACGPG